MKFSLILFVVFLACSSADDLFDMLDKVMNEGQATGDGYFAEKNDGGFCSGKEDGDYADPDNCNGFISCSNGYTHFRNCPSILRYDPKSERCEWPEDVNCGSRPTSSPNTTRGPTTRRPTTRRTTKSPPTKSPFCLHKKNGDYPDPNNCNGFITCSNGYIYYRDCPSNLKYDTRKKRCEWPNEVNCGSRPTSFPYTTRRPTTRRPTTRRTTTRRPTTRRPTTRRTTKSPPTKSPFCLHKKNGDYPDPNNCNGFITCSNGYIYYRDCPSNLKYDIRKKRCEWPNEVNCGSRPTSIPYTTRRPTTRRPTTRRTTKLPPTKSPFCLHKKNGDYPDPNNCNGFITCSNGYIYYRDCPSNLKYDRRKKRCEWPNEVNCGSRPTRLPTGVPTHHPTSGGSKFCRKAGNGIYRDPHNCLGFIFCYRGNIYFRNCRRGLRFNGRTKHCDLPRNVKCGGAGGGTFCRNKNDGDYVDVLNCNGFIKCSNGYTFFFDCPANLRFNYRKDECDWPENVRCSY